MSTPLFNINHLHVHLSPDAMAAMAAAAHSAPSATTQRFEFSADQKAVIDHKTGLMWAADESAERLNFADAEKHCAALRVGGFDDWRLPDLEELESIRDLTRHEPCIDTAFFKSNSSWVWTRTPAAWSSGCAWLVGFNYGLVSYNCRNYAAFVRAVRRVSPASQ